jgi:hypothetical protein
VICAAETLDLLGTSGASAGRRGQVGNLNLASLASDGLEWMLAALVSPRWVAEDLQAHFGTAGEVGYPERWFDLIGARAPNDPNRLTAEDIVALSALGVKVPPENSVRLLYKADADDLAPLLAQNPVDVDLWDAPKKAVAPGSAADLLWHRIARMWARCGDTASGPLTAAKLVACKRPRLIPVYGSAVRDLVDVDDGPTWWLALRQAMIPDLVSAVRRLAHAAELPPHVSELRVLDVVVRMAGEQKRLAVAWAASA